MYQIVIDTFFIANLMRNADCQCGIFMFIDVTHGCHNALLITAYGGNRQLVTPGCH